MMRAEFKNKIKAAAALRASDHCESKRKTRGPDKTGKRAMNAQQRIEFASIPEPNSGCWLWLGRGGRYGQVMFGRKLMQAHRLSWQAFRGQIPEELRVLHSCDTPGCVNPDHLFLGTQAENVRDMHKKGRARFAEGESHHRSKLTRSLVQLIRSSSQTTQELARKLGLDWSTVDGARKGRTWRHVQ